MTGVYVVVGGAVLGGAFLLYLLWKSYSAGVVARSASDLSAAAGADTKMLQASADAPSDVKGVQAELNKGDF